MSTLAAVLFWAIGALAVWRGGLALAGESKIMRKAIPVVALLWPLAGLFIAMVAAIAMMDAARDRLSETMGREDVP